MGRASLNRIGLVGGSFRWGLLAAPREADAFAYLDHLAFKPPYRIVDAGSPIVGNGLRLVVFVEERLDGCPRDVSRNLERPRGYDGFTGDPAPVGALAWRAVGAFG